MAAFRPRRSFARPLVITLAAAPAACIVATTPPPAQPTPVETSPQPQPQPVIVANPPRPQPQPQPQPQPVIVANPPRPQPHPVVVANPPRPSAGSAGDASPPEDTRWIVTRDGASCVARRDVTCGPTPRGRAERGHGRHCETPAPEPYTCPSHVGFPYPLTIEVVQGRCFVEPPPMHCPHGAVCNPPPPRRVPCPK